MEKSLLVVDKFGGSSVASSTQFQKVKNIVLTKPNRQVVVVSALGKENKDDSKITDLLYLLHAHIKYNVDYTNILNLIKTRYIKVRDELNIDYPIEKEFDIDEVKEVIANYPGLVLVDDLANHKYPVADLSNGNEKIYVGRIRRDLSCDNGLLLYTVADNIRKGAATNTVQIAQKLIEIWNEQ